jgi:hypothetical protein
LVTITSSPGFRSRPRIVISLACGGVAGDGHLLRVAAEVARQIAPDALDPGLQHGPHVVDRELVAEPEVPDHGIEHVVGVGTAAVVELIIVRSTSRPLDLGQ